MTILLFLHIVITIAMIGVILLQRSEGGGLGMGASPSSSMFSARGTANLLTRVTGVLFALFIGNCLLMGILSKHHARENRITITSDSHAPVLPDLPDEE